MDFNGIYLPQFTGETDWGLEALKELNNVTFVEVKSLSELAEVASNPTYQFGLINYDRFNEIQVQKIVDLRKANTHLPLCILANQIGISAYRRIADLKDVVTLQKPFTPPTLGSVLEKLLTGQLLGTSRMPRFLTSEPVRVMVMDRGLVLGTQMKNYSAGGAFLEYRGISLRKGDKLKLDFVNNLEPRPARRVQLSAKVVWVKDATLQNPLRGIGIQFTEQLAA